MPLISVVIPCFNVADTVAETIASAQAQTIRDFEIVAVDNNSTDATVSILNNIAGDDSRLRIVQQPVQGLSAARNAGIAAARGRFIALLDADDLWDWDYLASHLENLSDRDNAISYSQVRLIDSEGRRTGLITRPKTFGLGATDFLRSNPCTSMSFVVVPRRVFAQVGMFNESFRRAEDQEWFFRAALAGCEFRGIDRDLASYRTSPGALSSDLDKMLCAHDQLLDVAETLAPDLLAKERRLAHAAMLRYCARRTLDHKKGVKAARGYTLRMLRVAPDLLLREPMQTLKAMIAVLAPGVLAWRVQNAVK